MTRTVGSFGIAALVGSLALAGCARNEHKTPVLPMADPKQPSVALPAEKPATPNTVALGLAERAGDVIVGTVLRTTPYNPINDSFALIAETGEGIYAISVVDCGRPYPHPDALWLLLQDADTAQHKTRIVFARLRGELERLFTPAKMGTLSTCYIAPSEDSP